MSRKKNAWMPMYWGDYLRDTGHLGTIEHGAYLLLIGHYWVTGKPLPDDDYQLRHIAKVSGHNWKKIRNIIENLFEIKDGYWFHARIEGELKRLVKISDLKAEAGRKGGLKTQADARKEDKQTATPSQSPSQSQSTSVSKEDTDGQEAVDLWNLMAGKIGLSKVQVLTLSRNKKIKIRLKEIGGMDGWRMALVKVAESKFLTGGNDSGWTASFDFLLQPSSMTKLLEGNYDNRSNTDPDSAEAHTKDGLDAAERLRRIIEGEEEGDGDGE